jgi:YHS domain-containing protein
MTFALALLCAAAAQEAATNAKCPVSGDDVDAKITVVYKKNFGFCCGRCKDKFDKAPDRWKAEMAEVAAKPVNEKCPVCAKKADASKTVRAKGQLVAVCSANCQRSFEAKPDDYAAKVENAKKAFNDKCFMDGKANDPTEVSVFTKTIALCCKDCVKSYEKDPEKYFKEVK